MFAHNKNGKLTLETTLVDTDDCLDIEAGDLDTKTDNLLKATPYLKDRQSTQSYSISQIYFDLITKNTPKFWYFATTFDLERAFGAWWNNFKFQPDISQNKGEGEITGKDFFFAQCRPVVITSLTPQWIAIDDTVFSTWSSFVDSRFHFVKLIERRYATIRTRFVHSSREESKFEL